MTVRFGGDGVLKEFDYGEEVRDGSITRQAQEVKSNCFKMFLFNDHIETREHVIYAQHRHPDQGKECLQEPIGPLGPLPVVTSKGDHAPEFNCVFCLCLNFTYTESHRMYSFIHGFPS